MHIDEYQCLYTCMFSSDLIDKTIWNLSKNRRAKVKILIQENKPTGLYTVAPQGLKLLGRGLEPHLIIMNHVITIYVIGAMEIFFWGGGEKFSTRIPPSCAYGCILLIHFENLYLIKN